MEPAAIVEPDNAEERQAAYTASWEAQRRTIANPERLTALRAQLNRLNQRRALGE